MEKAEITADLVRRLVAEQFPRWAHLPVRPVDFDGWDNTTFRLGDELLARLPSHERYVPQVEKEQRWLPILRSGLPLPIPEPVTLGEPGCGFPRPWSVYRWLPGEPLRHDRPVDLVQLADDLASFQLALQRLDPAGGPLAGAHSFGRGGDLSVYDTEVRLAVEGLEDRRLAAGALDAWERGLASAWSGSPVWVHGDVTGTNLLVRDGRLSAVIDFGCCAVGDPACDLAATWTLFAGDSRERFRRTMACDQETWARARGWALWKAIIQPSDDPDRASGTRWGWRRSAAAVVAEVVAEHRGHA